MPYYEYECPKCKSLKELFRTMADRQKKVVCDHDGEDMVQVIGGAPGIRKGAGIFSIDTSVKKWGDYDG